MVLGDSQRIRPERYVSFSIRFPGAYYRTGPFLWERIMPSSVPDSTTCVEGKTYNFLGTDARGRTLIDQRSFAGFGGRSKGLIRFSEGVCEPIEIGIRGEQGVTRPAGADRRDQ